MSHSPAVVKGVQAYPFDGAFFARRFCTPYFLLRFRPLCCPLYPPAPPARPASPRKRRRFPFNQSLRRDTICVVRSPPPHTRAVERAG